MMEDRSDPWERFACEISQFVMELSGERTSKPIYLDGGYIQKETHCRVSGRIRKGAGLPASLKDVVFAHLPPPEPGWKRTEVFWNETLNGVFSIAVTDERQSESASREELK